MQLKFWKGDEHVLIIVLHARFRYLYGIVLYDRRSFFLLEDKRFGEMQLFWEWGGIFPSRCIANVEQTFADHDAISRSSVETLSLIEHIVVLISSALNICSGKWKENKIIIIQ